MAPQPNEKPFSAGEIPRRLCFRNGGFLFEKRLRRIFTLMGHDLSLGRPMPGDGVVVWGHSPVAGRGEQLAEKHNAPLVRVEDAFLRSVRTGRQGDAPLGIIVDPMGVHFDSSATSRLEHFLSHHELDDSNLLQRSRDGIDRIRALELSKYNLHDPATPQPDPGYVLIIDQTQGDASIQYGGASASTFAEMLEAACLEHPSARILIKSHPETVLGLRKGHFGSDIVDPRIQFVDPNLSPWGLLEGAIAVYTVSSQLGFEAILAGHRPHVFGQPFYAGWGLTSDRNPIGRRTRKLTKVQLFAAAMILAPVWYDPCRDRLCSFEDAVNQLEAEVRAHREDKTGYVAAGMRLWKRRHIQSFFGNTHPVRFAPTLDDVASIAARTDRKVLNWGAGRPGGKGGAGKNFINVEDGFLRSRGLGAELVPPLSLVLDDLGIYYDPSRPSRLEKLILSPVPAHALRRAESLWEKIVSAGLSKYNLGQGVPGLPNGHRVLVAGQVEDDASIRLGCAEISTNLALLEAARLAHPKSTIIYKPHPDVEAGLRPGAVPANLLTDLADVVASDADPTGLIMACDEVWTMTSLIGFEALMRGKPVTCLGTPFYAGWGLTRDLGPVPDRRLRNNDGTRLRRPDMVHLVHAALIAYPRYHDPISDRPCPPEVIVERLADGPIPRPGRMNRLLSKLQGAFASRAYLWRQ